MMRSTVRLDRHKFKTISQQEFDNILREFSKNSNLKVYYSHLTDDIKLERYIKMEGGKLEFEFVIFKNIRIDICLHDVSFTNCIFNSCNINTVMENCDMINSSFQLCTFDKWIIEEGNFHILDFIGCEFTLQHTDKIKARSLDTIYFYRCNGVINVELTCSDIQFVNSNMYVNNPYGIVNLSTDFSKMYFNIGSNICGDIKFSYSEIELNGLRNKKFRIAGNVFAESSKVGIDTFGMEDIRCVDIMKIISLNSNIFGPTGCLGEKRDVDMLVNNIIQTGNIGSRYTRTYYDAANDLVHCGCWENAGPVWNGDKCSGGSLEKFIARIDEVYPESSDDPKHKQYRKEYMNAINLFKSKKKSYAKKKEEYIKVLEERERKDNKK